LIAPGAEIRPSPFEHDHDRRAARARIFTNSSDTRTRCLLPTERLDCASREVNIAAQKLKIVGLCIILWL